MIDKDIKRNQTFSRRSFVIGAFQGVILATLGGRLAWLQLAQGDKYKTLSDKNRINTKMTAPIRGQIVDRYGVPLAINDQNFRVLLVPEEVEDVSAALQRLSDIIKVPDYKIEKALKDSKKVASFMPLEVADSLTWEEVSKLEVNILDLPGMSVDEGKIRNYPLKEATAHLVGYVGSVNETDLTKDNSPLLKLPGFRIGKTGLEKAYDTKLRGKEGHVDYEVNVQGRAVRELAQDTQVNGDRLVLSIDAELQRFCQDRLAEHKSASAVIMDAHTGAVYALSSHPSFDPNLFVRGIPSAQWQELLYNPAFPLNNKAVSGQYPPGSTFKMITALAALEMGVITPRTRIKCTGRYEVGSDKFHCWKLSGHGNVNVVSALKESCDTYFYELSTEVGIDKIAAMAHRFGLGKSYDFDLSEERSGLVPTKEWKLGKYGQVWRPGETVVASIGQGYILATPLQLAVMTSRLVNGGYAVKPWLIGYQGQQRLYPEQWPNMGINKNHLKTVMKGMDYVVNHEDGTAYGARITEKGKAFGGKTGTAQVKKIDRSQYAQGIMNEDLEWKYRHHALFVGYAPVQKPRYVCSVVVEHGGSGSATAAPLAKDLLYEVQRRDPASQVIKGSDIA